MYLSGSLRHKDIAHYMHPGINSFPCIHHYTHTDFVRKDALTISETDQGLAFSMT